jgi:UDP-N-acetylglucosamine:LPS N-acetylglucosamine transferase
MILPASARAELSGAPRLLWAVLLIRAIWTSAVADEEAVRFNLRLLWILTALFSVPDLVQGLGMVLHAPASGTGAYGLYVCALAALELGGALLLAARHVLGRTLIMVAAAGFYLEAALGLAGLERGLLATAVFVACAPAEAWVLWFLRHQRVRDYACTHLRSGVSLRGWRRAPVPATRSSFGATQNQEWHPMQPLVEGGEIGITWPGLSEGPAHRGGPVADGRCLEVAPSVLILTAHTGGGHDSVAAALADAFGGEGCRASVRVWALGDGGRRLLPPDLLYERVVPRATCLWGIFYRATNREGAARAGARLATLVWGPSLRKTIAATRPDLVVSVHPICARLASSVLRAIPQPPSHQCVVTDLVTVHRSWAAPNVAAFYVATDDAAKTLKHAGVPAGRLHVTGLPVRQAFTTPLAPRCDGRRPRVLLLGGGRAGPALERAATALMSAGPWLELVVVCGRNRKLQRRLLARALTQTTVLSWVENMAALMRSCDVVVTKAGSVSMAEAVSLARPLIIYDVLPGQEEGNLALLESEHLGRHVGDVECLPAAIGEMIERGATLWPTLRCWWWASATQRVVDGMADVVPAHRQQQVPLQAAVSLSQSS